MVLYRCEDSLEGILTGVYMAYLEKNAPDRAELTVGGEYDLFKEQRDVVPDPVLAGKVERTILARFGEDDYLRICLAAASCCEEKADVIFHTIAAGLRSNCGRNRLFDALADPKVRRAYELSGNVGNEECHLRGFVRFEELEAGILFARIGPKNDVLPFLMPHFADRFPMEHFAIYDERRELFGLHPAGKQWYLLRGERAEDYLAGVKRTEEELRYAEYFRFFCEKIAIADRRNPSLQRNLMPLRFRPYMTEFR